MRIKKTSQYIEGGASLSNVYGTSNENGYTQEYINGLNTYPTEEKQIGWWEENGVKKPLYRKTIIFGAMPNATNIVKQHNISNVDLIMISPKGTFVLETNGGVSPIPNNFRTERTGIFVNKTSIGIYSATDYSSRTAYVTLEYTKTTD